MAEIVSLILGGGQGARLYPLTKLRSKPAVPVGGKYRLIDIPISNCLNSGFNRIYILTQFSSVSLHRHISNTYKFSPFQGGFVELLAAQQTLTSTGWYQGTADAVRHNLSRLAEEKADHVLVLSGDQLYRMNFQDMLRTHLETQADVTLCALPVGRDQAARLGILRIDLDARIADFAEKPADPAVLERLAVSADRLRGAGIDAGGRDLLANMGIYLFRRPALLEVLDGTPHADFGKHVFPAMLGRYRLQTHLFDGYWEDLGTIGSFHKANLDLAAERPSFVFHVPGGVIYTHPRFLPGSRIQGAHIRESLIADGAIVERDALLNRCVLGVRSRVGAGTRLTESVILGADFYESEAERQQNRRQGIPDVGVGPGCQIERAIIDKNCRIGAEVRIRSAAERPDAETDRYVIRDGIVVIPKGTAIPEGTVI